jgi:alkylated DNA repair dioxygenase AlkB
MMMMRQSTVLRQADFFVIESCMPAGFAYRQDLITAAEEQVLLERFEDLAFTPFEFRGYLGKRRVVSFGWQYDFTGRMLRQKEAIPSFLLPLRQQAATFAGVPADSLQQVLINEYAPGAGIGWHHDKPMFRDVVAVSLGASGTLRLRRRDGEVWDRVSQDLRPRSAYLLRGASRWDWEHSVPPVTNLRYSVTFRNFVEAGA